MGARTEDAVWVRPRLPLGTGRTVVPDQENLRRDNRSFDLGIQSTVTRRWLCRHVGRKVDFHVVRDH